MKKMSNDQLKIAITVENKELREQRTKAIESRKDSDQRAKKTCGEYIQNKAIKEQVHGRQNKESNKNKVERRAERK